MYKFSDYNKWSLNFFFILKTITLLKFLNQDEFFFNYCIIKVTNQDCLK